MSEFKRELISFNESNFKTSVRELQGKGEKLQDFVDEYYSLKISDLEVKDLESMFNNTVSFFTLKLTKGEPVKLGGIAANHEKLFELLEKPEGTEKLMRKIIAFYKDRNNRELYQINKFEIVNKKVSITQETLDKIKNNNSVYIENSEQKQVFEILTSLANSLNKLKSKTGDYLTLEIVKEKFIGRAPSSFGNSERADFLVKTEALKKF